VDSENHHNINNLSNEANHSSVQIGCLEKTDLGGQSTRIMPGPLVCHVFRGNEPEPERAAAALMPFCLLSLLLRRRDEAFWCESL
jgi:hypothetical protein